MWFLILSLVDSNSNKWDLFKCFIRRQKIENSISNFAFLFSCIILSSIYDDIHKNIKIYNTSSDEKEQRNKRDCYREDEWEIEEFKFLYEFMIITSAIDIRDFFKCIANNVRLNESNKDVHKSKKTKRTNRCANINRRKRIWISWRIDYNWQDKWF